MTDELQLIIKIVAGEAFQELVKLEKAMKKAIQPDQGQKATAEEIEKELKDLSDNIVKIKGGETRQIIALELKKIEAARQSSEQTARAEQAASDKKIKADRERVQLGKKMAAILAKTHADAAKERSAIDGKSFNEYQKTNRLRIKSNDDVFAEKAKLIAKDISDEEKLKKSMQAVLKQSVKLANTLKRLDVAPTSKAEALEKRKKILVEIQKVTAEIRDIQAKTTPSNVKESTAKLEEQRKVLSELTEEYKDTEAAVKRFDKQQRDNEKSVAKQIATIRNLIYSLQNLAREADAALRPIAEVTKVIVGFVSAFAGITAGLGGLAVKEFAEMEHGLNKIQVLMDPDKLGFEKVRTALIDLSQDVPFTMDQILDAFFLFESTINKGAEGMEVFKVATKGAVAGFGELKDSATVLANIMNIFQVDFDDAEQTMDTLIKTANRGQFTFGALSKILTTVAASAKLTNVSVAELGAIVVAASKTFGGTERNLRKIITGLNTGLISMVKSLKENESAWDSLTDGVRDSEGQIRSMLDLLIEIAERKVPVEDILELFPNQRSAKVMLSMLSDIRILKREFVEINNATGQTGRGYEIMMNELNASTKVFRNNVALLSKDIATTLAPAIKETIDNLTVLIKTWRDYDAQNKVTEQIINDTLLPLFAKLNTSVKVLTENLPDIIGAIDFSDFKRSIEDFFKLFDSADLSSKKGIEEFVQKSVDLFTKLIDFTTGAVDTFVTLIKSVETLASTVGSVLPDELTKLAGSFGASAIALQFLLRHVVDAVLQMASFAGTLVLMNKAGSLLNISLFPNLARGIENFARSLFGAKAQIVTTTTAMNTMAVSGGNLALVMSNLGKVFASFGAGYLIGTALDRGGRISDRIAAALHDATNSLSSKDVVSYAEIEAKRFEKLQARIKETGITIDEMRTIQAKFGVKLRDDNDKWLEALGLVRDKYVDLSNLVINEDFFKLRDIAVKISGVEEGVSLKEQIELVQELKKEFKVVDVSAFEEAFNRIELDPENINAYRADLKSLYDFLTLDLDKQALWINKFATEAERATIASINSAIKLKETMLELLVGGRKEAEAEIARLQGSVGGILEAQLGDVKGIDKPVTEEINRLIAAHEDYGLAIESSNISIDKLTALKDEIGKEIAGKVTKTLEGVEEEAKAAEAIMGVFDDIVKQLKATLDEIGETDIDVKLKPINDLIEKLEGLKDLKGVSGLDLFDIAQFGKVSDSLKNIVVTYEKITGVKKEDIVLQRELSDELNEELTIIQAVLKATGLYPGLQDSIKSAQEGINRLLRKNVGLAQEAVSDKIQSAIDKLLERKQAGLAADIEALKKAGALTDEIDRQVNEYKRLSAVKEELKNIDEFNPKSAQEYTKVLDDLELKYIETIDMMNDTADDAFKANLKDQSRLLLEATTDLYKKRQDILEKAADLELKGAQTLLNKKLSLIKRQVSAEIKLRQEIEKIEVEEFADLLGRFAAGEQKPGEDLIDQVDEINEKIAEMEALDVSKLSPEELIKHYEELGDTVSLLEALINKEGWSSKLQELGEITKKRWSEIKAIFKERPETLDPASVSEFLGFKAEDFKAAGVEWGKSIREGLVSVGIVDQTIMEIIEGGVAGVKGIYEQMRNDVPSAISAGIDDEMVNTAIDGLGTTLNKSVYDNTKEGVKSAIEDAISEVDFSGIGTGVKEGVETP